MHGSSKHIGAWASAALVAACGSAFTNVTEEALSEGGIGDFPAADDDASEPAVIDVEGRLVNALGLPEPFTPVWVEGHARTVSDASGRFRVQGVTLPYDLYVLTAAPDDASHRLLVLRAVSRADPDVPTLSLPPAGQRGNVSGVLEGDPPGDGYLTVVFGSPEGTGFASADRTSGRFDLTAVWAGPATTTGTLFALSYDPVQHVYRAFGRRDGVTLTAGATLADQGFTLAPTASAAVRGTVHVPAGLDPGQLSASLGIGSSATLSFYSLAPGPSGPFAIPTPAPGDGARIALEANAGRAKERTRARRAELAPDTQGVELSLPTPPTLEAPAEAARDVSPETTFRWAQEGSPVSILTADFEGAGLAYVIVTAAREATLPDLAEVGLPFPAAAQLTWSVQACAPPGGIDALLGDGLGDFDARCEGLASSPDAHALTR